MAGRVGLVPHFNESLRASLLYRIWVNGSPPNFSQMRHLRHYKKGVSRGVWV